MARFRLVVLDMDGTLLTDRKGISQRTAAAVRACMERGIHVVLATARPYCSARPFAALLGLRTPLVCYNGALVKDVPDGRLFIDQPLPAETAAEMAAFCQEKGLYMKVYGDDVFYVQEATEETLRYSPRYNVRFEEVGDMVGFISRNRLKPYSFVVHARPERVPALREEMESLWAGRITGDCPNEHAIHFCDARATKLAAVQALAAEWGIVREEALAVGNGGNDLGVIIWAGLGVAMANSPEEVLRQADRVTDSNNDDGVALALERYVLVPPEPEWTEMPA